jgi:hypothetical protein
VTEGEYLLWKWTELSRFARDCQRICDATGVPYEHDFDLIRWKVIEENICRNPLAGQTQLDPRFDRDERRRVFRTAYAPAQTAIPPLVVAYLVVRFPAFAQPGVIEGREVWLEEELRAIGYSVLAGEA